METSDVRRSLQKERDNRCVPRNTNVTLPGSPPATRSVWNALHNHAPSNMASGPWSPTRKKALASQSDVLVTSHQTGGSLTKKGIVRFMHLKPPKPQNPHC